jgi:CubicO group peptidase (beta-lactamase class C family)
MNQRKLFLIPLLTALLALLPQIAEGQSGPLKGLDSYIERAMRDWGVPGVAVAIIKDDSVVHARGYGVRELGKSGKVDERTIFAIGSSSKAFTSASLALLVDEGKVSWDDLATKHLPDFQLYDPYATRELTIRDMLSHRSGLSRGDRLWYASDLDRAEVLRRVRFQEPSWSFRSTYGYNNIMILASGQIVESVTGVSWDDFVAERFFAPLGMQRSSTSILALEGQSNVATPHNRIDGRVRPVAWRNIDNIGPAGSINSSALDMVEWLRLQLGEGEYRGQRLISEKAVREMHAPQMIMPISEAMRELYPETNFLTYGLAWFVRDYRGRKLVGHGGAIDGMRAEVMMAPEEKLGIVVLTNLGGSSFSDAIIYRILDHYLARPTKDWSQLMLASATSREVQQRAAAARRNELEGGRITGTRPSLPLSEYTGVYADSMYGEVRITEEEGRLVARAGSNFTGDLEHWQVDTFRAIWRDPTLGQAFYSFRLNPAGKVVSVTVEGLAEFGRVREQSVTAAR